MGRPLAKWDRKSISQNQNQKGLEQGEEIEHFHLHHHPEIMSDIFSRLPVKSVLECKRVCRTWRTLVVDNYFAHMHLRRRQLLCGHHYHNRTNVVASGAVVGSPDAKASIFFIAKFNKKTHRNELYCGEYDENDSQQFYNTFTKINHPPIARDLRVVGSCNGLICFSLKSSKLVSGDPVYIYNPITREYVNLPKFIMNDKYKDVTIESGFGYHPLTNEYKVVRIYYYPNQPGQIQVYTLGSGNGWRNKEEASQFLGNLVGPYKFLSRGTLANGALHWMDERKGMILAFDLADEKFHCLSSCSHDDKLWVLGGALHLVHRKGRFKDVAIWSLKNNLSISNCAKLNEQQYQSWVWNKESTTSELFYNYDPLVLTNMGEILLFAPIFGKSFHLYDMKTASLKELGYINDSTFVFGDATAHVNSFVSLKALGEDANIIRPAARHGSRRRCKRKRL